MKNGRKRWERKRRGNRSRARARALSPSGSPSLPSPGPPCHPCRPPAFGENNGEAFPSISDYFDFAQVPARLAKKGRSFRLDCGLVSFFISRTLRLPRAAFFLCFFCPLLYFLFRFVLFHPTRVYLSTHVETNTLLTRLLDFPTPSSSPASRRTKNREGSGRKNLTKGSRSRASVTASFLRFARAGGGHEIAASIQRKCSPNDRTRLIDVERFSAWAALLPSIFSRASFRPSKNFHHRPPHVVTITTVCLARLNDCISTRQA